MIIIIIITIIIIIIIIIIMITKDYNNPKTITIISELNIGQWVRNRVTESTRCIAAGSILTSHLFLSFSFFIIIRPIIMFLLLLLD